MSRYRVTLHTHAWAYIVVDADNEDEAIEAAYDDVPDICAQCSGWGKGYTLELGEEWDSPADQNVPVELLDENDREEDW